VIRTAFQSTARTFPASAIFVSRDAAASDECGSSVAEGALAGKGKQSTTLQDDVLVGCTKDDSTGLNSGGISLVPATGDTRSLPVPGSTSGAGCGSSIDVAAVNSTHPQDSIVGCPTSSVASVAGAGLAIVSTSYAPTPTATALVNGKDCRTVNKRCTGAKAERHRLTMRTVPTLAPRTVFSVRVERRVKGKWRHLGVIPTKITSKGRSADMLVIRSTGAHRIFVDLPATATTSSATLLVAYITLS
jgi:hypothetical protein